MYVELILNGVVKALWYYDNAEFDAFCEACYQERQMLWSKIVEECKDKAGGLLFQTPYEMYINIRPKIQPKDISDEEYEEFERLLDEKQNNPITKLKRRFA